MPVVDEPDIGVPILRGFRRSETEGVLPRLDGELQLQFDDELFTRSERRKGLPELTAACGKDDIAESIEEMNTAGGLCDGLVGADQQVKDQGGAACPPAWCYDRRCRSHGLR